MTVKGNQPSLQREVFEKILPLLPEPPHHVTEENCRGRPTLIIVTLTHTQPFTHRPSLGDQHPQGKTRQDKRDLLRH